MAAGNVSPMVGEQEASATSARSVLGATAPWKEMAVDGVRLAYDDNGRGPEIVCLHAIAHGARDFERLGRRFGGNYRVIALDWPGHGNSGPDQKPASANRYTEILANFLDRAGIKRPVLVGNSIGGAVAINYAHSHPDRVRALVLENCGGLVAIDRSTRAAIGMMVRFFAAGERRAWWYPIAFRAYYRMVLRTPAAAQARDRMNAAAIEMAPILVQAWKSFAQPEADLRQLAPEIRCPVLFAWAKRDNIIALKRCLPAIKSFPNEQLETFDAGHAAHLETPDAFEQTLDRFLKDLPREQS
jgi:4,5:9,10-diseco-3-hydroxy-5,9,17-trioxoandrosta-1(10),2-diene-4-oate hydrolase